MIQKAIETAVNKALGMEANDDHVMMKACRIVILDRGWVVVGWVATNGDDVTIEKASVIRVWGTTKGIGEIAINGPTKHTILDPAGVCRAHKGSVVMYVDCDGAKWREVLK